MTCSEDFAFGAFNDVQALAYDPNGSMVGENKSHSQGTPEENRAYSYDFNDRLIKVEISKGDNSAQVVEYEYDPLGNRTARRQYDIAPDGTRENESVLYYLNDISGPLTQVLGTYDNQGNLIQSFMYGINRVAAFGQENYYFVCDGLGTVWGLIDGSGNLVENYSYDEWGVPGSWPAGTLNTFGFTGEDYDPVTGLVFLRARYYKPDIGRFITQDDVLGPLTDSLTWNLYIYARNNPVTLTDPSGKIIPLFWLLLSIFAVGFTGGVVYHGVTTGQWLSWGSLWWGLAGGALAVGGYLVGLGAAAFVAKIGLTGWQAAVAGGAITGGIMGGVSRVVFNLLQGKAWNEDLLESILIGGALGGLVGLTGYYVAKIPAISIRAPTQLTFQWKFTVSYIGPDTYRYLRQQIFRSVLSTTVRYEHMYIKELYSHKLPWQVQ